MSFKNNRKLNYNHFIFVVSFFFDLKVFSKSKLLTQVDCFVAKLHLNNVLWPANLVVGIDEKNVDFSRLTVS